MCYILISPTIHGAVQDRPEPSPRSKFYMGVKGTSLEDAKARNEKLTEELKAGDRSIEVKIYCQRL